MMLILNNLIIIMNCSLFSNLGLDPNLDPNLNPNLDPNPCFNLILTFSVVYMFLPLMETYHPMTCLSGRDPYVAKILQPPTPLLFYRSLIIGDGHLCSILGKLL